MHGERDLWPSLCWVRSSAKCLATISAILNAAVRSAGRAVAQAHEAHLTNLQHRSLLPFAQLLHLRCLTAHRNAAFHAD